VAAFAFRPPDPGHPYGHRKFETAATSLIGIALFALASEIFSSAFGRTTRPALPEITLLNWAVMAATIGVNLFVSAYEAREGRRLQSAFLLADATHTRADLYVSLGVVASFVAALLGASWADPLVAVVIAAIIAWQAGVILLGAFHVLTDRAAIPAEEVERLAAAVPGVLSIHNVRTRGRRDAVYVDLTLHLDGGTSLREAHAWPTASRRRWPRPIPASPTWWSTSSPKRPSGRRASASHPARVAGAELAQHAEAVDAGAVAVLPRERHRVVAHAVHVHELLALEAEIPGDRVVALAGGARAPAAQVVEREHRLVAVFPRHDDASGGALVADLDRLGARACHAFTATRRRA